MRHGQFVRKLSTPMLTAFNSSACPLPAKNPHMLTLNAQLLLSKALIKTRFFF
jgi:hypothetical protein